MTNHRLCSIEGCGKPLHARSWCSTHWRAWRRHGDPLYYPPGRARYGEPLAFLQGLVGAEPRDECIPWPWRTDCSGYGRIRWGGENYPANHVMCILAYGPPVGARKHGAHSCDNPVCVNPAHLRWDTHKGNHADRIGKGVRRLARDEAMEIRRRVDAGEKRRDVARSYGVSVAMVGLIARRQAWA